MFFLRKFAQYNLHRFKSNNQKKNYRKFVDSGFRSVVVITSASHAEGRQFNSGRKHFFFPWHKSNLKNGPATLTGATNKNLLNLLDLRT